MRLAILVTALVLSYTPAFAQSADQRMANIIGALVVENTKMAEQIEAMKQQIAALTEQLKKAEKEKPDGK